MSKISECYDAIRLYGEAQRTFEDTETRMKECVDVSAKKVIDVLTDNLPLSDEEGLIKSFKEQFIQYINEIKLKGWNKVESISRMAECRMASYEMARFNEMEFKAIECGYEKIDEAVKEFDKTLKMKVGIGEEGLKFEAVQEKQKEGEDGDE